MEVGTPKIQTEATRWKRGCHRTSVGWSVTWGRVARSQVGMAHSKGLDIRGNSKGPRCCRRGGALQSMLLVSSRSPRSEWRGTLSTSSCLNSLKSVVWAVGGWERKKNRIQEATRHTLSNQNPGTVLCRLKMFSFYFSNSISFQFFGKNPS